MDRLEKFIERQFLPFCSFPFTLILLALGWMNFYVGYCEDEPLIPKGSSMLLEILYYKVLELSNLASMMLINSHVNKSIRGSILECYEVKDLMNSIEEQFVCSYKAFASTPIKRLLSTRSDNIKGMLV